MLFEVDKWVKRERSEEEALQLAATEVVPLTSTIALTAADVSLEHGLAMAEAIVYATAAMHETEFNTSDRDFAALAGVTYLEK